MNKTSFLVALFCALAVFHAAKARASDSPTTQIMGYFDTEYTIQDLSQIDGGAFDQHRLAILIQHEIPGYRFFTEIEYKHAPAIEDALDGAGAIGQGEVEIERAYTDISLFGKFASLRVGKSLEPGLWTTNHYPNLQMSVTRPGMEGRIFKSSFVGLELHGNPVSEFYYHLWTMRGDPKISSNSSGHPEIAATASNGLSGAGKIGHIFHFNDGFADLSLSAAHYGDYLPSNPKRVELELKWNQIKFWGGYAEKIGVTGYYGLLSYTFPLGEKELSPYYLHDSLKDGASSDQGDHHAVGLNFRPRPEIAIKAEVIHHPQANGTASETSFNSAFVLFFN